MTPDEKRAVARTIIFLTHSRKDMNPADIEREAIEYVAVLSANGIDASTI